MHLVYFYLFIFLCHTNFSIPYDTRRRGGGWLGKLLDQSWFSTRPCPFETPPPKKKQQQQQQQQQQHIATYRFKIQDSRFINIPTYNQNG